VVDNTDGMSWFLRSIPYNYYALLTIVMMVTITLLNPTWCDELPFFSSDRTIDDEEKITINNLVQAGFSYSAYSTAR
jgi:hypothetical protein